VFATAKTSTGTVTVTNELTRATARLRIGRATDPEVRTSVQVGNTPEVQ
jgi:hypothetical protein